jgi:hypothetical protein
MLKFSFGTWNSAASTLSPTDVRVNCVARHHQTPSCTDTGAFW